MRGILVKSYSRSGLLLFPHLTVFLYSSNISRFRCPAPGKVPGQKNIDRVQLMYYHESDEHFFNIIRTKSFQMLIKPLRRYVQVIGIFRRI